jgi:hypothetical protein
MDMEAAWVIVVRFHLRKEIEIYYTYIVTPQVEGGRPVGALFENQHLGLTTARPKRPKRDSTVDALFTTEAKARALAERCNAGAPYISGAHWTAIKYSDLH